MRIHRRSASPSVEILDVRALLSGLGTSDVVGPFSPSSGLAPSAPLSASSGHHAFYVSPSGTKDGDGNLANPWDLQTALNQPAAVKPGATIWVEGGTYVGNFRSFLKGTPQSPINVRQYTGQRATLDGSPTNKPTLRVEGRFTWFWDLEITNSNPLRSVDFPGQGGPVGAGVSNFGVGTKLIDLIVHDTGDGIEDWSAGLAASDTEVYGCVIYNVGWIGTDRGHGHAIYAQNRTGSKWFKNNVIFDTADVGIQVYGSSAAYLDNINLVGNDVFNAGGLSSSRGGEGILLGGSRMAQKPQVVYNTVYGPGSNSVGMDLGYIAGVSNASVYGNYITSGGTALVAVNSKFSRLSGNEWGGQVLKVSTPQNLLEGNIYHRDGKNLGQNQVFVRPNQYETGRAGITVFNWKGFQTVSVDVSSAKLAKGQSYEVIDAQNPFGSPVLTGVFDGGPINIPMTGTAIAHPNGNIPSPPQHTGIQYGSFLLLPIPSQTSVHITGTHAGTDVSATVAGAVTPVASAASWAVTVGLAPTTMNALTPVAPAPFTSTPPSVAQGSQTGSVTPGAAASASASGVSTARNKQTTAEALVTATSSLSGRPLTQGLISVATATSLETASSPVSVTKLAFGDQA